MKHIHSNSFINTNQIIVDKQIDGLTSGQKVTFTATTTTGGLQLLMDEGSPIANIHLSLDGKALK